MTQDQEGDLDADVEPSPPVSAEAEEQWQNWKAFSLATYTRYQDTLEAIRRRHARLTSYDIIDRINSVEGTFAWWWGTAGEMRETINSLNAWAVRLHEWQAWNAVLSGHEEQEDKWDILHHFLEPIALYCMLQPSSFADRLALTAESLIHQANLHIKPGSPDWLMQDDRPGKPLRRSDRQKQLGRLGQGWKKFPAFQQAIELLNGDEYFQLTRDYRNLSAHGFAPRLLLGEIPRAKRSVVPWKEMVQQQDGTYLRVEHPTKKVVSYSMGSVTPLSLEETHSANLAEYQRAKKAIDCLIVLLEEICDKLHKPSAGDQQSPPAGGDPRSNQ